MIEIDYISKNKELARAIERSSPENNSDLIEKTRLLCIWRDLLKNMSDPTRKCFKGWIVHTEFDRVAKKLTSYGVSASDAFDLAVYMKDMFTSEIWMHYESGLREKHNCVEN